MMKYIQEAIVKAVKEQIAEREYLAEYKKGLKLLSVEAYEEKGAVANVCIGGDLRKGYMMRLLATFSFKPVEKYENNRVKFEIAIYSNGDMSVYFEGTSYEA